MTWIWVEGDPAEILQALAGLGLTPASSTANGTPPAGPLAGLPTILQVQDAVARTFGVTVLGIQSQMRVKDLVTPRHVAMYLARHVCHVRLTDIGAAFGKRDHSTVIHAVEKIAHNLARDPVLRAQVQAARDLLGKMLWKGSGNPVESMGKSETAHSPGGLSTVSTDLSTPPGVTQGSWEPGA